MQGINLRVDPGEIYGFLGPNGAGKSTTIHMLTTLLPPTSGTAFVGGHDIVKEGPAVRAAIGAALQEAALDPYLTAREHLRLQSGLHGLRKKEREERSRELLDARRADGRGRPEGADVLGRHEAATRPRAGARAPAPDPLPRRADDRPRPAEPQRALDRGRAAGEDGGRHRLPDDAVPRGGGRARRPRRDHRPRPDRRRRDAGRAEGRDRQADRRGDTERHLRSSTASRPCSRASASPCPPPPAARR